MVQFNASMADDVSYARSMNYIAADSSMDTLSTTSLYGSNNGYDSISSRSSTVWKSALLRKVKTNKKKYFVLHKACASYPAKLEYYDSESQWHKRKRAKRTIILKTCFSINSYTDSSAKYGLTLFTKDDSFQIGFESEQERDIWLADMSYLSRANYEKVREPVHNQWRVRASSRNMSCPVCGNYILSLNEKQATLLKATSDSIEDSLVFPLNVITRTDHNDNFFIMEVNEYSHASGPGELWMEVEDSLIARHVHQAFRQNMSSNEEEFRPVSKSLSHTDKKSLMNGRLRSGSDAKLRNRIDQKLVKTSAGAQWLISSSHLSLGYHRERSDSIDSYGTSTSMSTEESEYYRNGLSRSGTPDLKMEPYRSVTGKNAIGGENHHLPNSSSSPTVDCGGFEDYADMRCGVNRSQDDNSNFVYIDMSYGGLSHIYHGTQGYMGMVWNRASPPLSAPRLKPEVVKSFLVDDEEDDNSDSAPPERHYSVGSRPSPKSKEQDDEYVEMCRRQLSEKEKSSSAPHLPPAQIASQSSVEVLRLVDSHPHNHSHHHHRKNPSNNHRPRGSTWSQTTRPNAEHKQKNSSRNKSGSSRQKDRFVDETAPTTEYIDMTYGNKQLYVDMSLNQKNRTITSNYAHCVKHTEDKENCTPHSSGRGGGQMFSEPFPELSASSEDDLSLHSTEGSVSLHSLTSSGGDSMSMSSSHSSHCGGFVSFMDSDPYVSMLHPPKSSSQKFMKLPKVPSLIRDDIEKPAPCRTSQPADDYMEMGSARCKQTKRT